MDLAHIRNQLDQGSTAVAALARSVTGERARWKPAEDRWSVIEVMCHLGDIEVEDFRTDLEIILFRPEEPWPNFDIYGWVTERDYINQDLESTIARFTTERNVTLAWLDELKDIDPDKRHSGNGFRFDPLCAGDVLASWVAHDMFHIRQLALLVRDAVESGPYRSTYSGFEL